MAKTQNTSKKAKSTKAQTKGIDGPTAETLSHPIVSDLKLAEKYLDSAAARLREFKNERTHRMDTKLQKVIAGLKAMKVTETVRYVCMREAKFVDAQAKAKARREKMEAKIAKMQKALEKMQES